MDEVSVTFSLYATSCLTLFISLTISQLFAALAPWSIIAFRSEYYFFIAMEGILDSLFTTVFAMNQMRASSLQVLMSSVLYSSADPELFSDNTALINHVDADLPSHSARDSSILTLTSEEYHFTFSPISSPGPDAGDDHASSVPQELLSWNDAVGPLSRHCTITGTLIALNYSVSTMMTMNLVTTYVCTWKIAAYTHLREDSMPKMPRAMEH